MSKWNEKINKSPFNFVRSVPMQKIKSSYAILFYSSKSKEVNDRILREFRRQALQIELTKMIKLQKRRGSSVVLHPYTVGQEWKHLTYKDLHVPDIYDESGDHHEEEQNQIDLEQDEEEGSECKQQISQPTATVATTPARAASDFTSSGAICNSPFTSSPTKRLNKAVGNILQKRTPNKQFLNSEASAVSSASLIHTTTETDLDLALDDSDFPLEALDNDLISSILRDGNFEEELNRTESPGNHGNSGGVTATLESSDKTSDDFKGKIASLYFGSSIFSLKPCPTF